MTIPHATVTAGMIGRDCAHFAAVRGERDGWEAVLGARRQWQSRIQHAESQPHRFGGGAWMPAVKHHAALGR